MFFVQKYILLIWRGSEAFRCKIVREEIKKA